MSGQAVVAQIAEHVPGVAGGGIVAVLLRELWSTLRGRKPIEDAAHTTVEDFLAFNERLGKEIERLDGELTTIRAKHGKLSRYAAQLFRWALDVEAIAKAAGLETPPQPDLPGLD